MFNKKKVCVALSAVLALSMIVMPVDSQAAKKIKLSKTKLTMKVGSKKTVSIKNAKKSAKVTWKSNKKKIATVKKSGKLSAKITAKKVGNAVITCKVKGNKSKLTIKVKVAAKSSNSQATKAPESTTTPAQTSDATPSATATPNAEPTPFVPVPYSGKGFDEKGLATFEDGDTAGFAGRGNASVTVADEGYCCSAN